MDNAILMASSAEDIDFMIHGIFSYEIFGHTVWITTTHVCILIVMLTLLVFAFAVNRKMKHATDVPDTFQNIAELIVEKLDGVVEGVMGKNSKKFKNYISTIFIFILFSMITFCKFKYQKVSGVLKGLCDPWPIWAPINIIGDLAVPVSLSLRLFANVLSGTVIMALVYGLLSKIAVVWPAALHVYFDLFSGAIQTYVFCLLTMTYVNQAMETE